jgi:hydrogenase maturation factor
LLATVSEEKAHEVIKELHDAGYTSSAIIGKVGRVNEFLDTELGEAKKNSIEEILWLKF